MNNTSSDGSNPLGVRAESRARRMPPRVRDNLVKLRQETGRTVNEFAKQLDVAPITWSKYESGTRMLTPRLVRSLALHYGVDPDSLYRDVLLTLGGSPFNRDWFNAFATMSLEKRKEFLNSGRRDLIFREIERLVHAAHKQHQLEKWVPAIMTLLKRMSAELGVRPPVELLATDYEDPDTKPLTY